MVNAVIRHVVTLSAPQILLQEQKLWLYVCWGSECYARHYLPIHEIAELGCRQLRGMTASMQLMVLMSPKSPSLIPHL